jgi:hypothetical protein
MIIISILIIIFSICKIRKDYSYTQETNRFYTDFKVVATRYLNLYYYFITLKSLIIFGENDYRWKYSLNVMENMMDNFEKSNIDLNNVFLSDKMSCYNEVQKLFEILQYNKKDSVQYLNDNVCGNVTACKDYLKTEDNIFLSGIDNGYKTCFTYMNNIINDYKNIKNKKDVNEIMQVITCTNCLEFRRTRKTFSQLVYYVQQMIYSSFEHDYDNFRIKNNSIINSLNIYSIVFSFIIFFFVFIIIFLTVNNFIRVIQDSVNRVNNSTL